MAAPRPSPPIIISATISTISAVGNATCNPVMICGSAAGSMISPAMCRSVAPKLCADQISSRSTPCSPAIVAVMIGNTAVTAMMVIFEISNRPNHKMNTGRNAILGIGKPIETSGSKNQRAHAFRIIRSPSDTPAIAAIANPMNVR